MLDFVPVGERWAIGEQSPNAGEPSRAVLHFYGATPSGVAILVWRRDVPRVIKYEAAGVAIQDAAGDIAAWRSERRNARTVLV